MTEGNISKNSLESEDSSDFGIDVETLTQQQPINLVKTPELPSEENTQTLNVPHKKFLSRSSVTPRMSNEYESKDAFETQIKPTKSTISLVHNLDVSDEEVEKIRSHTPRMVLAQTNTVKLDDIISDEKLLPDTEEYNNVSLTYTSMKNRIVERRMGIVFSNTSRGFSYITFIFLFLCFIAYILIATLVLHRTENCALEYIVFFFIFVICAFSNQYVSPLFHALIVEFNLVCYPFFLIPDEVHWYSIYICSALCLFLLTVLIFASYKRVKRIITRILGFREISSISRSLTCTGQVQYVIQDGSSQMTLEGKFDNGKAEGFCTWLDTAEQGELLIGTWIDGVPVGPFESTENNSRTMMKNVRILFATDADGTMWGKRKHPFVGVAGVECIISGNYYSVYPKVNMVLPPKECRCGQICHCFKEFIENGLYVTDKCEDKTNIVVTVDHNNKGFFIGGYRPIGEGKSVEIKIKRKEDKSYLTLDDSWMPLNVKNESEGLIYIHSGGMSLTDSLKKMGQLLALGNFPGHVVPICFNWPVGKHSLYGNKKAKMMANNIFLQNDFVWLLQSLYQAKFKRVHILCHGVGGYFFLQAFETIQCLFSIYNSPNDITMSLVNLVLMNCDCSLEEFKNKYQDIKNIVQRTTIYSDRRDKVLKISEKLYHEIAVGHWTDPLYDDNGDVLERVEVIDTGDLERNDDGSNHGFFNVNKLMVDDLFELIGQNKGASYRSSHLLREKDNKYRFSLLPKSVTMV
ncbi:hypothetical protein, conserved [Entamoeba dispar SAW760]|uniref:Uncharacterized protein n=1 Tax=Entamoeba dispar (strain ATCC PRA-260 / SAW760) TaxID=370354 RepID=B0EGJ2_ENTDS|nr:uncharacterized protein EDI_018400 [Entamoeba dispar SAW760]EDR26371.1 hypothetical protein, conserved [Entamoeba dispar SAW760]|eukprot:EDR26371.1 hypothetical protein, conserved [Entamoeba dispar SAW760]